MSLDSLRDWIRALDEAGELVRVRAEVDPRLEIAEITDRVIKEQGAANRALLCEKVKGSAMPVLITAWMPKSISAQVKQPMQTEYTRGNS